MGYDSELELLSRRLSEGLTYSYKKEHLPPTAVALVSNPNMARTKTQYTRVGSRTLELLLSSKPPDKAW